MWDDAITLLIVAAAAVYVARRLFLKPHCGPSDGCSDCSRTSGHPSGEKPLH
ncbi:MAG: hypothetical protein KGM40_03620 [Betaproteobacteria bacterium]|nr:hypothetical protein [Betaproteobacteria bacterium]MDE1981075.1 hypothetical protein [Betaproteobacteria bacterium]MDE2211777.1 hypothetical protein [Betaproteobacteria bacterium]MDE2624489.1 hypothetical protein [Betaproteobacteria bacterium]